MKAKLDEQVGAITFEGLEATKFWLRTFNLTDTVDEALKQFAHVTAGHDRISCPIISEYKVNEELSFYFVILCTCDRVGLLSGVGKIYFTSPKHIERVIKARNDLGDYMLKRMQDKPATFSMIPPGKESEQSL